MLLYHPYKSDKPGKKYYIITNSSKKVYFGQASASDPNVLFNDSDMENDD